MWTNGGEHACQTVTRNILDCDQSNVLLAHYFPLMDARILEISLI